MPRWKKNSTETVANPKYVSSTPGGDPTSQLFLELKPTVTLSGWSLEESGVGPPAEDIHLENDYLYSAAGGYDGSTHYARIKKKMPEAYGVNTPKKWFQQTCDFWLPADFYTGGVANSDPSYMRFFNTDNYGVTVNGVQYGAVDPGEWRIGFFIFSDRKPRLLSTSQKSGNVDRVLWMGTAEQLTTGRHVVTYSVDPKLDSTGSWKLVMDGVTMSEGTGQTVPTQVPKNEIAVTRVNYAIDGAAEQDAGKRQLNMRVYSGSFLWNI